MLENYDWNMPYLRNSILATIIYYDTLDYPLTSVEVHKYMINPVRLTVVTGGVGDISLYEICEELDRLVKSNVIGVKNGFYYLTGRDDLYDLRIKRNIISNHKWKIFLRQANLLTAAPYLRGFFGSGSLAMDNASQTSDFDVFVIARDGRLYTCRFFLWLISSVFGIRRKVYQKIAPDKFCFNHYITDRNMLLDHQSLYTAQAFSNLKPVYISSALHDKFFEANLWINNYLYNFKPEKEFSRRSIKLKQIPVILALVGEFILDTFVGDFIENILKKYQQDRIMKNPLTGQPGGRVVCSDSELEFHPHSFEKIVIEKYNQGLKKVGIFPFHEEKDSGLTV